MLPYFVANFTAIGIFYLCYQFQFNRAAKFFVFLLAAAPMILITGFKYYRVGTDTGSYIYYFNKIVTFSDAAKQSAVHGEAGYWYLSALGHTMTHNYFIIFLLSSFIITGCYFYALNRFNLKVLSLITLLFIGPYYFQLNGTRQAIAISIFFVALIFLLDKKMWHYLITIAIGFLFHKSMIICLPLYFLFKDQMRPKKVGAILFVFLVLLVFFESFISVASEVDSRYSSYGEKQDSAGGAVVSLFNFMLFCWFLFCRNLNPSTLATRNFDILLTLYLLGVLIGFLSIVLKINPSGFLRMSIYFIQINVLLVPLTILSFKENSVRWLIGFGAIGLMMAYYYMTTSAFSNLTPYRFNPVIIIEDPKPL